MRPMWSFASWLPIACVLAGVCSTALSAKGPETQRNVSRSFAGTKVGQVASDNGLSMELLWIPPGKFTMGSPKTEKGRLANEGPVEVTLTKGSWLGKYEVTQLEWQLLMQTTPWKGANLVREGDDFPATYVTWDDAMKFSEKFTQTERRAGRLPNNWKYTLPTEAQWEYACRAGTTTRFSFGDDEAKLTDYGWFDGNTSQADERYAHAVGLKKANPWGLYDMHGNVYEWCLDPTEQFPPRLSGGTDPRGTRDGTHHPDRGGGWEDAANKARSANRDISPPSDRNYDLGFRVAAIPTAN